MPGPRPISPIGQLIEDARRSLGLSGREAARRAGVSEGRWRQIVRGVQPAGGTLIPAVPKPKTVVRMAVAVGVDPAEALRTAGHDPDELGAILSSIDAGQGASSDGDREQFDLDAEIERIERLQVSASTKLRLINAVLGLYEEAQREQAGQGRRSTAG